MSDTATASEITLTRIYDAPRQAVWDAWTQPDQIARWWGKRGWNTPPSSVTMDVRPGGVFRLNSIHEETGAELPVEAVFREVVEPERLSFAETPRDDCHEGAVGTVTFTDLGDGRTEMRFRTTIEASEEIRRSAAGGLASAFDRLAEHLGG
jgi:uncharacterized protein YndB with AHSA1/START domain